MRAPHGTDGAVSANGKPASFWGVLWNGRAALEFSRDGTVPALARCKPAEFEAAVAKHGGPGAAVRGNPDILGHAVGDLRVSKTLSALTVAKDNATLSPFRQGQANRTAVGDDLDVANLGRKAIGPDSTKGNGRTADNCDQERQCQQLGNRKMEPRKLQHSFLPELLGIGQLIPIEKCQFVLVGCARRRAFNVYVGLDVASIAWFVASATLTPE